MRTPCFGLIVGKNLIEFRIAILGQRKFPRMEMLNDNLRQALDVVVSENAVLGVDL